MADWTRREVIRVGLGAMAGTMLASRSVLAGDAKRIRLHVRKVPIEVGGRRSTVAAIVQDDGTHGYCPDQSDGFHVEVLNELDVPTSIHWHGLVLPDLMDGVPWVTQPPIEPGQSMAYDFPLVQSGTYWMHSHYGLQEQYLVSAPLTIWNAGERAKADRQFTVTLSDFSFTPAAQILEKLKEPEKASSMSGKTDMKMDPGAPITAYAQVWKDGRLQREEVETKAPDIDVRYDALLANRKTVARPDILEVERGESVLLRLVAASSATDFYVDTGTLDAELTAVDGKDVAGVPGNYFQLAIAQRVDLLVRIPESGGAFPILVQGEGVKDLAGVVLATKGANIPELPSEAALPTKALDNTQERLLRASSPLPARSLDRTLPVALGGTMAGYTWTINGEAYPNRNSLNVKRGERVALAISNPTGMGHPMHLHGHDFQVVEIDGVAVSGALRDTLNIPSGSTIQIAFDAENPGIWAFHCHIIYHLASGMFTVLKYDSADTQFWKPEESAKEVLEL